MKITAEMSVLDIMNICPPSQYLLMEYGLHCIGCAMAGDESLEAGLLAHGFTEKEIAALVEELNNLQNDNAELL